MITFMIVSVVWVLVGVHCGHVSIVDVMQKYKQQRPDGDDYFVAIMNVVGAPIGLIFWTFVRPDLMFGVGNSKSARGLIVKTLDKVFRI